LGRTSKSDTENPAPPDAFALRRVAFTIPEFCYRNAISRVTYHRLRAQGRGPVELRFGLNSIRITAEAERDWQHSLQQLTRSCKSKPPRVP
jgi:hypothetical protein